MTLRKCQIDGCEHEANVWGFCLEHEAQKWNLIQNNIVFDSKIIMDSPGTARVTIPKPTIKTNKLEKGENVKVILIRRSDLK